jgi:hypothetical protein
LFLGFGGSDKDGEDVWVAGQNGECTLINVPAGKAPADSFKTKQECREAQDSDYNCEGAGICKAVPKGTGKYKSKSECEKAVITPSFTGGQCVGVKYIVTGEVVSPTWNNGVPIPVGGFQTTGLGPILWIQTRDQQFANTSGRNGWYFAVRFSDGIKQYFGVLIPRSTNSIIQNITISVAPDSPIQEPPEGCGNPAKVCPL